MAVISIKLPIFGVKDPEGLGFMPRKFSNFGSQNGEVWWIPTCHI